MISPERKAKIRWNCRRGMLELDLLLNAYVEQCIDDLSEQELAAFEQLLEMQDPELYYWCMGEDTLEQKELADIVQSIRSIHNAQ